MDALRPQDLRSRIVAALSGTYSSAFIVFASALLAACGSSQLHAASRPTPTPTAKQEQRSGWDPVAAEQLARELGFPAGSSIRFVTRGLSVNGPQGRMTQLLYVARRCESEHCTDAIALVTVRAERTRSSREVVHVRDFDGATGLIEAVEYSPDDRAYMLSVTRGLEHPVFCVWSSFGNEHEATLYANPTGPREAECQQRTESRVASAATATDCYKDHLPLAGESLEKHEDLTESVRAMYDAGVEALEGDQLEAAASMFDSASSRAARDIDDLITYRDCYYVYRRDSLTEVYALSLLQSADLELRAIGENDSPGKARRHTERAADDYCKAFEVSQSLVRRHPLEHSTPEFSALAARQCPSSPPWRSRIKPQQNIEH